MGRVKEDLYPIEVDAFVQRVESVQDSCAFTHEQPSEIREYVIDYSTSTTYVTEMSEFRQFEEKRELLEGSGFQPVDPLVFYRELFPVGSFERLGHQEDSRPNGLMLQINESSSGVRRGTTTILTDGLEQITEDYLSQPFTICSPISYFGRSRKTQNASMLYALTLDIDYVNADNLEHFLFTRMGLKAGYGVLPQPTYLVNTGHGIHLYYILNKPIPLYPHNKKELLNLKKYLIDLIWDKYVSYKPENKEALSLFQGFRMVGSRSKLQVCRVTAYKMSEEKCDVRWLASFDRANKLEFQLKENQDLTLEQAKELYPDWYERRIINKENPKIGNWRPKRDLYDWWFNKAIKEIEYGHRYFGVMCLAIFAIKCGISEEELRRDALELQEEFEYKGSDPFTLEDMEQALKAYHEDYRSFTKDAIERVSGLEIPKNKRNGRKQEDHLEIARAIKKIKKEIGEYINEGRPKGSGSKKELILQFKIKYPEATQREIAKKLNVSPTTVNKWLKTAQNS